MKTNATTKTIITHILERSDFNNLVQKLDLVPCFFGKYYAIKCEVSGDDLVITLTEDKFFLKRICIPNDQLRRYSHFSLGRKER